MKLFPFSILGMPVIIVNACLSDFSWGRYFKIDMVGKE